MIYALADKSIRTRGFTSCIVSILMMISSINNYFKLSMWEARISLYTHAIEMTLLHSSSVYPYHVHPMVLIYVEIR